MKTKTVKRQEAVARQDAYDLLTTKEKLTHTVEGTRQYKRLKKIIEEERKAKKKAKEPKEVKEKK